ncbi:MAG: response regulator [Deltaproteobacteria bacterium]|nr:response regulator [Deltaproteobacteria bacterium]MBW1846765.1 response regulator [Deltaproteobacteria bacterium]
MDGRLLMVESDNLFWSRLVERLRQERFHVYMTDADCRFEINEMLKKNKIDVVVIDLSELKREGLMILESIQQSQPMTEVILINSSDQISLSIEGMKLGAYNDFMLPLDMDYFLSGVREAVFKKKQQEKKH